MARQQPLNNPDSTRFLRGPEHPCAYLPGRRARNLYCLPGPQRPVAQHTALSTAGFRRSGELHYRPDCPHCNACQPARIPVADFSPSRSQRRAWQRNTDLRVSVVRPTFSAEHYALYRRYISHRHGGGVMDEDSPQQYRAFILGSQVQTRLWEFRLDEQLLAVAVVDELLDGFSAMYTFYDPELPHRGLGTCAILSQIEAARARGLQWLYLGFWIRNHPKMDYKRRFRPLQIRTANGWERL